MVRGLDAQALHEGVQVAAGDDAVAVLVKPIERLFEGLDLISTKVDVQLIGICHHNNTVTVT